MKRSKDMDLDLALALIDAAKAKAKEIGVPMVIAVVDTGGNLSALQRMDQALLVSLDIAVNKAYSAVAVKVPTHELAKVAQPGQPLFGIHNADRGRIVIFGGGFPLSQGNEIIGGIGVSGGSVEQDMLCAEAALKYLSVKPKLTKAGKAKK
jgi:uncharacterized protein GlcG (DUF336 family)